MQLQGIEQNHPPLAPIDAAARLREFIYLLAHDLRGPVATAIGLSAFLDEAIEKGDLTDAKELSALVVRALRKMDKTMEDLTVAIRTGALDMRPEWVDLKELVDEIVWWAAQAEGGERIEIAVEADLDGPVLVKRLHLRSALENLLSNAVKYANPAEPAPQVRLVISRGGEDDHRIEIEVTDNGLGIPSQFHAEVFEVFQRFHPQAATGSGLGLHLVQLAMKALGGQVLYQPLENGSRFSLAFTESVEDQASQ